MTKWQCPFCGGLGKPTDEHVWAKWLRQTQGARKLLQDQNGQRMPLEWSSMQINEEGRYESSSERQRDWATLLPHVTVKVCKDCNNGWMSELERRAQSIIGPLVLEGRRIWLGADEQMALAQWAIKVFMAYALTLGPLDNPFPESAYGNLIEGRLPAGCRIWLAHFDSRFAQVGLAIKATALLKSFDPIRDQNNAALGYLAAGGLVFLLVLVPEALEELGAAMSPPMAAENGTAFLISQPTGLIALTHPALDEGDMALVMSWLESMRLVRMPAAEGLTPADFELLQGLFEGGADPAAIRTLVPEGLDPAFLEQAANHEHDTMAEASRYREAGDLIGAGLLLTHQGRQHFQGGDFEGASRLLIAAIESPGSGLDRDAEAAYRVGQCFWNLHDARAESWYKRAIELGLDLPGPRFGIVDTRARNGDYTGALEMLWSIEPEDLEHQAVLCLAIPAFDFLVHELGVGRQSTAVIEHPIFDETLADEELNDLVQRFGALNREMWRRLLGNDERVSFHFARAWFGDHPVSWVASVMVLAEVEPEAVVEAALRLGLQRVVELPSLLPSMLDAFHATGMGAHPGVRIVERVARAHSLGAGKL